jgi:hypothetical protein
MSLRGDVLRRTMVTIVAQTTLTRSPFVSAPLCLQASFVMQAENWPRQVTGEKPVLLVIVIDHA